MATLELSICFKTDETIDTAIAELVEGTQAVGAVVKEYTDGTWPTVQFNGPKFDVLHVAVRYANEHGDIDELIELVRQIEDSE